MSLYRRTSDRLSLPRLGRTAAVAAATLFTSAAFATGPSSAADPAPCTITWDGGAGHGYLASPANWTGDRLPGASDIACIGPVGKVELGAGYLTVGSLRTQAEVDLSGGAITITGSPGPSSIDATLNVRDSGRLVLDGDASASRVVQSDGAVVGSGRLAVGDFVWSGGQQSGSGTTEIAPGSHGLTLGGDGQRSMAGTRTLRIPRDATGTWTSGQLQMGETARLDNSGTIEIRGDYAFIGGGSATVINELGGEIRKTSGTGTGGSGVSIVNRGLLEIQSGSFSLGAAAPMGALSDGTYRVARGATLRVEAPMTFATGSRLTGDGSAVFTRGTQELDGSADLALVIDGAAVRANSDLSLPRVELRDGRLEGPGAVSTPDMEWTSGSLSGTGRMVIEPGGPGLAVDTPQGHGIFGRTLEVSPGAVADWKDGTLMMADSGTIENRGLFDLASEQRPGDCCDYSSTIHNAPGGVLGKSTGHATTRFAYTLRNDGRVEASSGTLAFGAIANTEDGTLRGGKWVVGATLELGSGEIRRNAADLTLDGPESRLQHPDGTSALDTLAANDEGGSLTVTGGREIALPAAARNFENAGTVSVGAGSTIRAGAAFEQIAGSTTLADASSRLVAGGREVNIDGGRLSGPGTVDATLRNAGVVAPADLSAGAAGAPGSLTVTGDYVQSPDGTLETRIAGVEPGTGHDLVDVAGQARLAGTLVVDSLGGFLPSAADEFELLRHSSVSGEFERVAGLNPDTAHSYPPPDYTERATILREGTIPSVSITDARVSEGDSGDKTARFDVSVSPAPTRAVRIAWATADGSATAPGDYEASSGTIVIPHGQSAAAISVPVHGDRLAEPDETFHVDVSEVTGASIVGSRATATVVDDDPADGPPVTDPGPGSQPPGSGSPPPPVRPPKVRRHGCSDRLAPLSAVKRPHPPRAAKRRRLTLRGSARDIGCARLRKVAIAVARRVKAHGRAKCRWVGPRGKLGRPARCDRPRWLAVKGTGRWKLRLRRPLARGSYLVRSQAIDRAGNRERRVRKRGKAGANAVAFRVR